MILRDIPRAGRGESYRGRLMIYAHRGLLIAQKWPRKRGKPKSAKQRFWVDWFTQANRLAKYADPMSQARAIAMTKGTGLYPRDVLLEAMRGRLYWWADETGWKWFPMAATQDVSNSLDTLAQTIGSVLVRAVDRWRAPDPGVVDDVLTLKGTPLVPVWTAGGGGGLAFGGALLTKSANQNIVTDTWVAVTFDGETYDTDAIHDNVVNPTRLTVPAGWTKVRLYGGASWQASNTGIRWLVVYKNGADFHGSAMNRYLPSGDAKKSIGTPPIPCIATDYFELMARTSGAGTKYVAGPSDATFFAMERVV